MVGGTTVAGAAGAAAGAAADAVGAPKLVKAGYRRLLRLAHWFDAQPHRSILFSSAVSGSAGDSAVSSDALDQVHHTREYAIPRSRRPSLQAAVRAAVRRRAASASPAATAQLFRAVRHFREVTRVAESVERSGRPATVPAAGPAAGAADGLAADPASAFHSSPAAVALRDQVPTHVGPGTVLLAHPLTAARIWKHAVIYIYKAKAGSESGGGGSAGGGGKCIGDGRGEGVFFADFGGASDFRPCDAGDAEVVEGVIVNKRAAAVDQKLVRDVASQTFAAARRCATIAEDLAPLLPPEVLALHRGGGRSRGGARRSAAPARCRVGGAGEFVERAVRGTWYGGPVPGAVLLRAGDVSDSRAAQCDARVSLGRRVLNAAGDAAAAPAAAAAVPAAVEAGKVFVGVARWSARQLREELRRGCWLALDAAPAVAADIALAGFEAPQAPGEPLPSPEAAAELFPAQQAVAELPSAAAKPPPAAAEPPPAAAEPPPAAAEPPPTAAEAFPAGAEPSVEKLSAEPSLPIGEPPPAAELPSAAPPSSTAEPSSPAKPPPAAAGSLPAADELPLARPPSAPHPEPSSTNSLTAAAPEIGGCQLAPEAAAPAAAAALDVLKAAAEAPETPEGAAENVPLDGAATDPPCDLSINPSTEPSSDPSSRFSSDPSSPSVPCAGSSFDSRLYFQLLHAASPALWALARQPRLPRPRLCVDEGEGDGPRWLLRGGRSRASALPRAAAVVLSNFLHPARFAYFAEEGEGEEEPAHEESDSGDEDGGGELDEGLGEELGGEGPVDGEGGEPGAGAGAGSAPAGLPAGAAFVVDGPAVVVDFVAAAPDEAPAPVAGGADDEGAGGDAGGGAGGDAGGGSAGTG